MSRTQTFDQPENDIESLQDRKRLPKSWARGPYRYVHNAAGWELAFVGGPDGDRKDVKNWEFLPILSRIEAVGGANGVTYDKETQRWNFQSAASAHAQLGNLVIEPNNVLLGKYRNYASRFFPTDGGFKRYIEVGEKFVRLPNGECLVESDVRAYYDFLRHLKKVGLVEPMESAICRAMVRTIEHRISQLRRHGEKRQFAIEKAENDLRLLKAAWNAECERARKTSALELDEPEEQRDEEDDGPAGEDLPPWERPVSDASRTVAAPTRTAQVDQPAELAEGEPEAPAATAPARAKPAPRKDR